MWKMKDIEEETLQIHVSTLATKYIRGMEIRLLRSK